MQKDSKANKFILFFEEISNADVKYVGGKNASLGEMYSKLVRKGVNIPNGFALTAKAYRYFLAKTDLDMKIRKVLKGLDTSNMDDLSRRGRRVRQLILETQIPDEIAVEIKQAYIKLSREYKRNAVDVAVRSSATAEDLPDASFAGQQESYLNVQGENGVVEACKKCIASLFTNRAISYRVDKGFDHFSIALSVGVQKMVRSDKASSGVMFTLDTESGFQNVVMINSIYGLGENIVQGRTNPDEFFVFKPLLNTKFNSIISKELGSKKLRMIYSFEGNAKTKNIIVSNTLRNKFSLNDKEIIQLAKWAVIIEKHYNKPMDIEWAKDGLTEKLYIVQARPETVQAQKEKNVLENYVLQRKGKLILSGQSVGFKIGQGKVQIIKDVHEINRFRKGSVLVTGMTDPDWEPIMKKASAIVTDSGGRTCHAAIVSRELGIPCVVGTKVATEILKKYSEITVSCAEGEEGRIYEGKVPFQIEKTNLRNLKRPKTKLMLNIGNPYNAFSSTFLPNDGVGLAREEFIIANFIKVHPNALIHFDQLDKIAINWRQLGVTLDELEEIKSKINSITAGYKDKTQFYVEKLAYGVAKIAAPFYPNDVIVRLSDFKSNEYANLIGGKFFEPVENNPMIGFRGASRYYNPDFVKSFELECKALKKVRDEMGLTNVKVMVPFCRTVEEGKKVISLMEKFGLKRGANNLEVYVMCEIPSNVILADQFCKIFDGFSIGTNDLTQLALGVDRDSELIACIYDERNEAVRRLLSQVIKVAHQYRRKVGICGEAPSNYPEFAKFLEKEGIDSMSLEPDSIVKTMKILNR